MLGFTFLSENEKKLKKWRDEYEKIVLLIHLILAEYSKHHHNKAKKLLIRVNTLFIDHITYEKIEISKLVQSKYILDKNKRESISEWNSKFKNDKNNLMQFLIEYSSQDVFLDEEFYLKLTNFADILIWRINEEEEMLKNILEN